MNKAMDPLLFNLIENEHKRQNESIELIASENYVDEGVLRCLGSCLTNKYSEGQIGHRYYGGNQHIDEIETLCKLRALKAFNLSNTEWHVNVQPYSGSPANLAVYTGLLKPHDRIMGLGLPDGGHLTHGFFTAKKKVSATSIFFESMPYGLNQEELIDYDALEQQAMRFQPRLIICGASAYPRDINYARFKDIADKVGAYLMCDMAHVSGLVAAGLLNNPFLYCDVVTTTTHKTLQGPRSGMIFCKTELAKDIDDAVFPGLQGGPHNHQIAAVAYQLGRVCQPSFKTYARQVISNAKVFAIALQQEGFKLATGGTNNHLVLVKLRPFGISGSKLEFVAELVDISLNKNTVQGDTSPLNPTGVRLGTSAMTTRGFQEDNFKEVAKLLRECVELCIRGQEQFGRKLQAFKEGVTEHFKEEIASLKQRVNTLALTQADPVASIPLFERSWSVYQR